MIRTERLTLRAASPDDLGPLHAIFSSPLAMRYWDRPEYKSIDETKRFLTHFMHAEMTDREEYIIEFEGVCIGKAGMWKKPEIGYILHPDYWGHGFAVEALGMILPRCFERFPSLPVLTAEMDPRNTASRRVLEKVGFQHVRTEEKNFLYGETEWCDTAYFELPRPGQV